MPPQQIKGGGLSRLGTPDAINHLAEPIHTAITSGFAEALQTVFLAAVPFAVLGSLVLLVLREIPLRTTQHSDAEALTLAFETGVDLDAEFTDNTTPGANGSPNGQPSGDRASLGRPEIPGVLDQAASRRLPASRQLELALKPMNSDPRDPRQMRLGPRQDRR